MVAMHLSHLILAAATIVLAFTVAVIRGDRRWAVRNAVRAVAAMVLALLGLCTLNLIGNGSFRPAPRTDAFVLARLLDARIAQPVLHDMCRRPGMRLCAIIPSIDDPSDPLPGQSYLWKLDLPRYALMHADPAGVQREEQAIVAKVFRTRKAEVVGLAASAWMTQLITAHAGDGMIAYGPDMMISQQIAHHFPHEAAAYRSSLQQQGRLRSLAVLPDRPIAVLIAMCLPLIALWGWRHDRRLFGLAVIVAGLLLVNAAVCGILSGVFDRYESRVLWLLPLLAMVALFRFRPDRPLP